MIDSSVYDLLDGLDGEDYKQAVNLIGLAGQMGMDEGQFFSRESAVMINALAATPIYDEDDNLIHTIPHPDMFFDHVLLGKNPLFHRDKTYHMVLKVSKGTIGKLWQMREMLLDSLHRNGCRASAEYELVAEILSSTPLTPEEIKATVRKHFLAK